MDANTVADLIHAAMSATNNAAYLDGRENGNMEQRREAHAAQNDAVIAMWRAFWTFAAENTPPM